MKIGVITNFYPPFTRGGAERIAEKIANGLAHRGHQVFVVTTKPKEKGDALTSSVRSQSPLGSEPLLKSERPRGRREGREVGMGEQEVSGGKLIYRFYPKNLYWLGYAERQNWFKRFFWHIFDTFNVFSYWEIRKILKKEKPDAVLTHNLKGIGFLIPPLLKRLKIKHIHTLHDIQLLNPSGIVLYGEDKKIKNNNFIIRIYVWICRELFDSPDVVISPSKWLLGVHGTAEFFPRSEKKVLPNPIMLFDFDTQKKEGGEVAGKLRLIYVGQLERHKGILWLIESFKKLKGDEISLNIVGGGRAMVEAQKLAQSDGRIHFRGFVEQRDLGKIFGRADLCVVPSLCYENSPSVIYESLYYGVPVVASRIGGVGELIEVGKNGFTFEPRNEEEFIGIIKYLLASPDELKKMKEWSRSSVAKYNLDNYIAELEKLIDIDKK